MSEIKLLIIATTKFELDGITNVILNYYRAMDKTDLQIDFVIPNQISKELLKEIKSYGSRVFVIENRNKNPISYMLKLSKIIKMNQYDIVHAHGNSHTLAIEMYTAKKCGVPIRIPHSHNTTCKYKFVHNMLTPMFNSSYTHGFACGKEAGEWLFGEKPFQVILNGIHIEKYLFNPDIRTEYREALNLVGKKVIGHVGALSQRKNQNFLIEIFKELYKMDLDFRLILIGDGNIREELEKKVKGYGFDHAVHFLGKRRDVPELMQAMDMIIMPSLHEGLPLTLVEAQTAGLPCYVSDTITTEVNLTGLVKFISLEEPPLIWARKIYNDYLSIDRSAMRQNILNTIIEAGYSIKDNATFMKKLYKKYLSESKTVKQ